MGGVGEVLIEVPTPEEAIALPEVTGIHVDWGFRSSSSSDGSLWRTSLDGIPQGDTLRARIDAALARLSRDVVAHEAGESTVTAASLPEVDVDHELLWEVPPDTSSLEGLYAWVAGEAAAVRDLRRGMVAVHHMDRRHIAFMGYWRDGKSEI